MYVAIIHCLCAAGVLSASLCDGGWNEVMSLVQHRAEFFPDAQLEEKEAVLLERIGSHVHTSYIASTHSWVTIKDEMPVEAAIGLAPSSCSVHACVELNLAWPGNL